MPAFFRTISIYFGNKDPKLAIAGSIALIIVGNQPFYPLYVFAIAGHHAWPALLTWLSTPFFILVPVAGRSWPLAGKLQLLGAAIGNTLLTAMALGTGSLVELFYLPCLVLVPLLFARSEAIIGCSVALIGVGIGLLFSRFALPGGFATLSPDEMHSLGRLHEFSVTSLLLVFVYLAWRARRCTPR